MLTRLDLSLESIPKPDKTFNGILRFLHPIQPFAGVERPRWTDPTLRPDDLRRRAEQGPRSRKLEPLPVVGLRRPELPARQLRV